MNLKLTTKHISIQKFYLDITWIHLSYWRYKFIFFSYYNITKLNNYTHLHPRSSNQDQAKLSEADQVFESQITGCCKLTFLIISGDSDTITVHIFMQGKIIQTHLTHIFCWGFQWNKQWNNSFLRTTCQRVCYLDNALVYKNIPKYNAVLKIWWLTN